MGNTINFLDQVFYFFSSTKWLHLIQLGLFILVAWLTPVPYAWPIGLLYLAVLIIEFIVYVQYQYAIGQVTDENTELKQQAMPHVVIASDIAQTEMEKFGRIFLAITTIEGLPTKKFFESNVYELSKQTGIDPSELRELYGKTHLHMAKFLVSDLKRPPKIGFGRPNDGFIIDDNEE